VKRSVSERATDTGAADTDMTRRGAAGAFLAFGAAALAGCVTEGDDEATAAIAQALTGSDIAWVDTVLGAAPPGTRTGDLATNDATALGATVAIARGCVAVGDGGGGVFVWDPDTNGVDDGGTVIVPGGDVDSTGAHWRRLDRRYDIRYFGARDNGANERVAIQNAINAAAAAGGGTVHVSRGTYVVGQDGSYARCLEVKANVALVGDGRHASTLKQIDNIAASVRLLHVTGDDARVADLTLDGNKGEHETPSEHRHGIFADGGKRLMVERVTSTNFTGDGFYLYQNAAQATFRDVLATGNDRNGITMGAQVDGVVLSGSRFIGNGAQQVDSEAPGHTVNDVTITGCVLDGAGISDGYVLTISGSGTASRSRNWTVSGNVIRGGINVVWADDVTISGNTGVNPTTSRSVRVYRRCRNVTISGNTLRMTQTSTAAVSAIEILGTGTDQMPERVLVSDNTIQVDHPSSWAVRAQGAISVTITDNTLRGAGVAAAGYAGIYLRTSNEEVAFRSAIVRGNTVSNFGEWGIRVNGNGTAELLVVDISANVFDDDTTTPAMTTAISFDTSGAVQQQQIAGNSLIGGVTTMGP
jgi:hypothetical protein